MDRVKYRLMAALALLVLFGENALAQDPRALPAKKPVPQVNGVRAASEDGWIKVSAANLEQVRGGFDTGTNFSISFGIQRTISVNGVLIAATAAGVANPFAAGASLGSTTLQDPVYTQPPGTPCPGSCVTLSPAATFVQNALNGQTYQVTNKINATENVSGALGSIALLRAMQNMGANSLRH